MVSEKRCGGAGGTSASPEPANGVAIEGGVVGYKHQVAGERLGDEHTVEGVAMGTRERAGAGGVGDSDGQFFEVLVGYGAGNVGRQCHGFIQSAPVVFGGYLPSGGRADEDDVRIVVDSAAGPPRQSFAPVHPPNEGVGVKQQPQLLAAFPHGQLLRR